MKHTRLYAKITDNEAQSNEWVVLVPFDEAEERDGTNDDQTCYVQQVVQHGKVCFKVKVDEGYCVTTYYYPINRYFIAEMHIYH